MPTNPEHISVFAPQWSPFLSNGMTQQIPPDRRPVTLPQWSPFLSNGMTQVDWHPLW